MYRRGDKGSPCQTPFFRENNLETIPLLDIVAIWFLYKFLINSHRNKLKNQRKKEFEEDIYD
jgi:hypothetical protein